MKRSAPAAPPPPPPSVEEDFSALTADDGGPTLVQPAFEPDAAELAPAGVVSDDEQARAFAAEVQAHQEFLHAPVAPGDEGQGSEELLRLRSELHAAEQLVGGPP